MSTSTAHRHSGRDGLPDLTNYSLGRALRQAAQNEGSLRSGLEAEVSQELARRSGRRPRGFLVPFEARNLGFGGSAGYSGLATAQATVPGDMLIDVLRSKLALERLGATIANITPEVHSGGGVRIPVKLQSSQVSWVDDGTAPASQSNMVVANQTLTPHTCSSFTDVTRRMLQVGTPGFEDRVVDDLMTGLSVGIDAAGLNGAGANNTPLGLFQMADLTSFTPASDSGNGGAPVWNDLVALEKAVGVAGGDSPADARIGFVTSPAGRSIFRRIGELGSSGVIPAWKVHTCRHPLTGEWETHETCMGYAAVATTNVPANIAQGSGSNLTVAALGNFADLVVNLFTEFDVLVNPYLQSQSGVVRVSAFVDADSVLRHQGSFALLIGINAT